MSLWRQLTYGVRALADRATADRDVADEVQQYLEQATAALVASGLSPDEARKAARLELGNATVIREQVRSYGWENAIGELVADMRYATRQLLHDPGFAAVSILTLALGIGATTAIFSALNPILFQPLPYPHAGRIEMIWYRGDDGSRGYQSFGNYRELAQRNRSFSAMAVMKTWQPTMPGPSHAERFDGQMVSAGYFDVLGVAPALGRSFQTIDDVPNGPKVVVLSDGLWRRRFNGNPDVIGGHITLDDDSYAVVGVMPRGFENVLASGAEVWSLLEYDATLPPNSREWGHHLGMVGRIGEGVAIDAAKHELAVIAHSPRQEFPRQPGSSMKNGLSVSSLQDDVTRGVRPALLAVLGAVMLVLVIASVNVTNLLLARGAQRRGEFAMRIALGAGQRRLIAQLLTESLLLAAVGGAVGLAVAEAGVRVLVALSPPDLPRVNAILVNGTVFAFAFALSTLIGVAVGLVPAWQALHEDPHGAVQQSSRRTASGRSFTRRALIVGEVAIALVLLVTAGLLLRSMERLFAIAPGFDASQVITMQVQTYGHRYDDDAVCRRFFAQALEAASQVPGVTAAAFTSELPLSGDMESTLDVYGVEVESRARSGTPTFDAFRYAVTPDYFKAMGIPLRRGRLFEARDMLRTPVRPVLINESAAKRIFAGRDPIGQRVRLGGRPNRSWDVIIGVVGDVKQISLAASQSDAVYVTTAQWLWADGTLWLVARGRGDAAELAASLERAIWSADKTQPVVRVTTMEDLVAASAAQRRFVLMLFEAFASLALALAAIGLYGILSGSVTERTREIGLRAALGASRGDIIRLVAREGMWLTGLGSLIGLSGAAGATHAIVTLLFGVSPLDPITYIGVLMLLVLILVLACGIPAWRATRVDPALALRAE